MPASDSLTGHKAESGSRELVLRAVSLEWTKLAGDGVHFEPRAVVSERNMSGVIVTGHRYDDARPMFAEREIPGVVQKVLQYGAHEAWVAQGIDTCGQVDIDDAMRLGGPQLLNNRGCEGGQSVSPLVLKCNV